MYLLVERLPRSTHLASVRRRVYHRGMRRLVTAVLALALASTSARADGIGLGFLFGDPTGIDLKIDLQRRSALDIVVGLYDYRFHDASARYGHLTYLVTPVIARGRSVNVPLRIGIGGAVFGFSDEVDFGVRVPFEVALAFRTTPLEIYGEVAPLLILTRDTHFDWQGGIGLRFYF
jgi:hypothetical protein